MKSYDFKKDYPALSTISSIFSIIGVLVIIISIGGTAFGIILLDGSGTSLDGFIVIGASIIGLLFSLTFIGFAELIKLLIRIELNTRSNDQNIKNNVSHKNPLESSSAKESKSEYEEWKKKNPGKSLNDFYAQK